MPRSISSLIREFFEMYPKQEWEHGPVVDWVTEQYLKEHPNPPRDPWRAIRKLHQDGFLINVRTGVYMYDPDLAHERVLWDFSPADKERILRKDGYRCVVCGRGKEDGVSLAVDHIKPKDKGGTNSINNGQTLCNQHNLQKKNYSQTAFGKIFFIKLFERAQEQKDRKMISFCQEIFNLYDHYQIDEQINRPDKYF